MYIYNIIYFLRHILLIYEYFKLKIIKKIEKGNTKNVIWYIIIWKTKILYYNYLNNLQVGMIEYLC